jgi:hypothetical protein
LIKCSGGIKMQIVGDEIKIQVCVPLEWFKELEEEFGIRLKELPKELISEFFSYSCGFGATAKNEFKEILDKYGIPYTLNE